ncbi:hypothetical protein CRU98_10055 [Arcobacter sp. CECT 8986]|uniref:hypothetical protein n=1 Tax=Arcobacter sp. CECT 8986 TaxID=2044507 RepID=UPI001009B118|nr:hypothetical protein [Arcobacter sp. CECT 8986]RXJ98372.1 hypothetical protein CRU98_10055 [Arcobacter sp. CECT 8986]
MPYYDNLGGDYSIGIIANADLKEGDIAPSFDLPNVPKFKKPNFRTLFENMLMHDPDKHRRYFLSANDISNENKFHDAIKVKFDKTKIKLQTVNNNTESNFVTLSTSTVAYLKMMDELFVKSSACAKYWIDEDEKFLRKMPDYKKGSSIEKQYLHSLAVHKQQYEETQRLFKEFIADFTRALGELNTPFVYNYKNKSGDDATVGVGLGNFYPGEIGNFIRSVFGDVIDFDDFVPAYNEELYNRKLESTCCLEYEIDKDFFRKKDLPYSQSIDYQKDDIEFQKFKQTSNYIPYKEPPSYKTISINPQNFRNYINKASRLANNPLSVLFDELQPYLEEYLGSLPWLSNGMFPDGFGGYESLEHGYKISKTSYGAEITFHADFSRYF